MHLFCGRDAVALPTAKPGHTLARPGHCLVQERSDVEPEFDDIPTHSPNYDLSLSINNQTVSDQNP